MPSKDRIDLALSMCKGNYQRGIVLGQYALSGADLKGKAKRYGRHYARSRHNLLMRLRQAGLAREEVHKYGKRVLVII